MRDVCAAAAQRLRGAMSAPQRRNCAISIKGKYVDRNRAIAQISRCAMYAPQRRKDCGARCLRRSGAIARLVLWKNILIEKAQSLKYCAARCRRRSGAKIVVRNVCTAAAQLRVYN